MLPTKNPRAANSAIYIINIQAEPDLLLISISFYKNR